jgi:hypothetical protein
LPDAGLTTISIFNSSGKIILEEKAYVGKVGLNQLNFSEKIGVGLHFVQIKSGSAKSIKVKMVNSLR